MNDRPTLVSLIAGRCRNLQGKSPWPWLCIRCNSRARPKSSSAGRRSIGTTFRIIAVYASNCGGTYIHMSKEESAVESTLANSISLAGFGKNVGSWWNRPGRTCLRKSRTTPRFRQPNVSIDQPRVKQTAIIRSTRFACGVSNWWGAASTVYCTHYSLFTWWPQSRVKGLRTH